MAYERTSGYGLTEQEWARLHAVPWPQRMYVAEQMGAERQEREAAARQAGLNAEHEAQLAYVAHTRRRADEETRKHFAGQRCEPMFCRATAHLL
jgi:hypothetical protein